MGSISLHDMTTAGIGPGEVGPSPNGCARRPPPSAHLQRTNSPTALRSAG